MKPEHSGKKPLRRLFVGAQVAAIIGTAIDFLVVIFLTEVLGMWYVASNACGAAAGAISNFLLGRYWVFDAKEDKIYTQASRYVLVAIGSLVLNTLGVYLLTEFFEFHYIYSKVFVAIFIAITYNFLLQKNFVYKK